MNTLDDNSPEDLVLAEKLFGWMWMSWLGTPVREDSRYPKECRVRQLMSPKLKGEARWRTFLEGHSGRPATGDEPLAYCYTSTGGSPESVPCYTTVKEADELVRERAEELWAENSDEFDKFVELLPPDGAYEVGDYSRAALKVINGE